MSEDEATDADTLAAVRSVFAEELAAARNDHESSDFVAWLENLAEKVYAAIRR